MNILSLQRMVCGRTYKMIKGVRNVDPSIQYDLLLRSPSKSSSPYIQLGYCFAKPYYLFSDKINKLLLPATFLNINGIYRSRIQKIARKLRIDIINTHTPDELGYYAKQTNFPVVHDIFDTFSFTGEYLYNSLFCTEQPALRSMALIKRLGIDNKIANTIKKTYLSWEKFVHERCDGLIYTSQYMLDAAKQKYSINCPTVIVPNAVLQEDLPTFYKPKLSEKDGKRHVVFTGHITKQKLEVLLRVSKRDICVHVYPICSKSIMEKMNLISNKNRWFYVHDPLPYKKLLIELTQYDFGLILWYEGATDPIFQLSLPNKLFEYLAAGLPIITGPYYSISDYIKKEGGGWFCT